MQYSDGDWYYQQQLAAFPPSPFCSLSPLLMSDHSCSPDAAAPAPYLCGLGDCCSDLILREEEVTGYLPVIPAVDAYLPPLPPTAGVDDALLLMPFSDTDFESFDSVFVNDAAVVPVEHSYGAQQTRSLQITMQPQNDRHDDGSIVVFTGYETAAQKQPAARRVKRRSDAPATAVGRSLQHVGLEELRKYFYMPITKAAQEMNVGLTVLKKRCRELGVARWPHRKMKSLRSLISNVQEMGKGMSPAALQEELEALEIYCAMMEENPAIELCERTKKLRQACFKENYKRRRAAATVNMFEHCSNPFGNPQLPLLPQEESSFFGY